MHWDPALNQVFRGCGTRLDIALRSGRYFALLELNGGNKDAAILDLLGENLIRAAWDCLPELDQRQVEYWPEMTAGEQLQAFDLLLWRQHNPPEHRVRLTEKREAKGLEQLFLPQEMGPWNGDKPLGNCFTMALMIMAYLQHATGRTDYYAAAVQRLATEPVYQGLQPTLERARRLLERYAPEACESETSAHALMGADLEDARVTASTLATRRQFHNAVIYELPDGRWICIDPYQNNLGIFAPDVSFVKVRERLEGWPERSMQLHGSSEWAELSGFAAQLEEIEAAAGAGLLTGDEVLARLTAWHDQLWQDAKRAATKVPHYSLSLSDPARSVAVRALINARLRDPRQYPVVAADLLGLASIDTVFFHAMHDPRDLLTPEEMRLLTEVYAGYRRGAGKDRLHPLLEDLIEKTETRSH